MLTGITSFSYPKVPQKPYDFWTNHLQDRTLIGLISSSSQMFFKTAVLKNFAIFTGKHTCWSPLFKHVLLYLSVFSPNAVTL